MRVVPVLDLKGGHVVHGVGGRREEYRPVVSRLTDSSAPADVATAFRDRFGLSELYVADLDDIAGTGGGCLAGGHLGRPEAAIDTAGP
jgi:phosphoribosylformimino-5-aminoimidazole carboxamide ribotide isomerase